MQLDLWFATTPITDCKVPDHCCISISHDTMEYIEAKEYVNCKF